MTPLTQILLFMFVSWQQSPYAVLKGQRSRAGRDMEFPVDSCPIFLIFLCDRLFTGLCIEFSLFVSAFVSVILCCLYAVHKSVMFRNTAAV